MATTLNPYLAFRDNAREAMEFYKTVFGGRLDISEFKAYPMPDLDPAEENKVMHSYLEAPNGVAFMAADTPNSMEYKPGTNMSMSLSGDDEVELRGYFDKLAEGGAVMMPLEEAPWGDTFGMLTDKFGIRWMVNVTKKQNQASGSPV